MSQPTRELSRVTRSKQEAERSYDRLSRVYDALAAGGEGPMTEEGLRLLNVQPGEWVLEIGCGTGRALVPLMQAAGESGRCIGVDISAGMLDVARGRLAAATLRTDAPLVRCDALSLPFRQSFDAVLASFVVELFDTAEILPLLLGCQRLLRPNGRIVVVCLSAQGRSNLARRLYEWAHRACPRWVDCRPIVAQEALVEAGFVIADVKMRAMWSLPVEITLAHLPRSLAQEGTDAPRTQ